MDEKANEKREISLRRIALYIITVCFLYLFMVTFLPLLSSETKLENNYSNTVVGIVLLLIGYYWGSSSGSTAKSEAIDAKLNPPITSQTVTLKSTETIDKTTESVKPVVKVEEEVKPK